MLLLLLAACGRPVDADGDGVFAARDCDDADASVGAPALRYLDEDLDGWGRESVWSERCPQVGWVLEPGDCDDGDPSEHPDALEPRCTCGGADAESVDVYADQDGDGVGAGEPVGAQCGASEGLSPRGDDCDDADSSVFPGQSETWYDGVDSDCEPDDYDADRDGFDAAEHGGDDCDDLDPEVNPGALEFCDAAQRDEDCDGLTNGEDPDARGWTLGYVDSDGDGYGTGGSELVCAPGAGFADNDLDCAPEDPTTYPGADEICGDGVVNDCGVDTLSCGIYGSMSASTEDAAWVGNLGAYASHEPVVLSEGDEPVWLLAGSFVEGGLGVIQGIDSDGDARALVVSEDTRGTAYALDAHDPDQDGVHAVLMGSISTYRSEDTISQGRVWYWPDGGLAGAIDDHDSITGRYGDSSFGYRVALLDDGILVTTPWFSADALTRGEVYLFDLDPGPEATWLEAEATWTADGELSSTVGIALTACALGGEGREQGLVLSQGSGVHLLDPDSPGALGQDSRIVEDTSRIASDFSCADVDGDGYADLNLLTYTGLSVHLGSVEGFEGVDFQLLLSPMANHVVAGDLDGEGSRDVVLVSSQREVVPFYGPFEAGSYTSEHVLLLPEGVTSIAGQGQERLLVTTGYHGFLLAGGPGY